MNKDLHNWAVTVAMIHNLDKDDWIMYIAYFLKDNILLSEPFHTDIYEDKNLFITDNDEYLLYKIDDNVSSYVLYTFRADFIE